MLAINGTNYTVTVLRGRNGVEGYRLVKTDGTTYDTDGTTYDLATTAERWTCDCPDALRAALKAVHQL